MLSGLCVLALAGCSAWASMGRNPFRAGTSPLGRPRPSDGSGLYSLLTPGALTSAAQFLKIPFLFCLKFQKMYLTFKNS
jgi:hypothetical protein